MDGVGCVLEKDGKFLFQLRDDEPGIENPNKWGLFGGTVEKGESHVQAIIREVNEELGINLRESCLEVVLGRKFEWGNVTVFKHPLEYELEELVLNEGQEMKLFTKEELRRLGNLGTVSEKIIGLI